MSFQSLFSLFYPYAKEAWYMVCFICFYLWIGIFYRLPPHRKGDKQPVVLIPGFLGKGLEFYRLRKALIQANYPVYVVPLGFQMGDIERKKQKLTDYLEGHDLQKCILIGYSMGGLVATGLEEKAWGRVKHFITIGVAFKGTPMAYLLPFSIASWQLMPHSALIQKYQKRLNELVISHTNIMAAGDEIAPFKSSLIKTAQSIISSEFGHLNLVMGRGSIQRLLRVLSHINSFG